MLKSICLAAWLIVGAMAMPVLAADPPAQTQPADTWSLSDVVLKDVREVPGFLAGSTRTTLGGIQQALGKIFQPLIAQIKRAHVDGAGQAIFVYRGASGAPDQEFTLTTGFIVPPDTKDLGQYKVQKLPAIRAATAYYTGSVAHMGEACGRLYGQVVAGGYTPTDQMREIYLWWEGPDSPNNVVELQVGVRPQAKAADDKP
jgi:effector-binding domain-containing protein